MISLCTFVKNEENCIAHMVESVVKYIDEIVVVDTGSTDRTIEICEDYGARVYHAGLISGFGALRTLSAHLAREEWVLMLDADEALDGAENLRGIIDYWNHKEALALPRKRWADLGKTKQVELEAYPDWQVRIFKNNVEYVWKRELHEYFHGAAVHHLDDNTPELCIDHFHDPFKSPERLKERDTLYSKLAKTAGVTKEGGHEL